MRTKLERLLSSKRACSSGGVGLAGISTVGAVIGGAFGTCAGSELRSLLVADLRALGFVSPLCIVASLPKGGRVFVIGFRTDGNAK